MLRMADEIELSGLTPSSVEGGMGGAKWSRVSEDWAEARSRWWVGVGGWGNE